MDGQEKFINPFTDFGFKRLFGTEFNKELLIDFLNQVLGDREHIKDLNYLNTENQGKTELDRKAVFDLYCENERGEKFIIEVQNVKQQFFKDRSIFYATFPIQEQAEKGRSWSYRLDAIYTIGILDFVFDDRRIYPDKFKYEIKLLETETKEVFYDKLTFIYLEMPKFSKNEEELKTRFDKWMYVLQNLPRLQNRPKKLQEKIFQKLFDQAEIAKLNPEDMKAYEESLKVYRDNYNAIQTIVNEKVEEKVKEIVRELKRNGASIQLIAKSTGLTKEQIEKL